MAPTTRSRRSGPVLAGPGKASFSLNWHDTDARTGDGCYGRDLRVITRRLADGWIQSIAADMREAGLARRYVGRKLSWC